MPKTAQIEGITPEERAAAAADKAAGNTGTAKPKAKPKAKAKAKPKAKAAATSSRQKYPAQIEERNKLVRLIDGYKNPASPKQQAAMQVAFAKALKTAGADASNPSLEALVTIAGLYGSGWQAPAVAEGETAPAAPTYDEAFAKLVGYARSEGGIPRELKPLKEAVDPAAEIRPRHVAAALIAYGWQIDGSAGQRLAAANPPKAAAAPEPEAAPEATPETPEAEATTTDAEQPVSA